MITEFIGSAHADLIDRQKLLRNLMVIDLIVKILKILKDYNPSASIDRYILIRSFGSITCILIYSPQQMVSRACFRVLEVYLKGKSGYKKSYYATTQVMISYCRKNDIYLAKHMQLFREYAGLGLKIESMLTENNK